MALFDKLALSDLKYFLFYIENISTHDLSDDQQGRSLIDFLCARGSLVYY